MLFLLTGRGAARILLAASVGLGAGSAVAQVQPADPAELDPNAPMAPMPDLGVAWPDMSAPDATAPAGKAAAPSVALRDAAIAQHYRVQISGIDTLDGRATLVKAFNAQSALVDKVKSSANAAQIDRRARADADLLEQLLRAQGYYDANVDPEITVGAGAVDVVMAAEPGARYRFAGVDLPGLDAAGNGEVDKLRAAFAVKAGDPVVADQVIAAGIALKVALGEQGFATADVGEQDIVIDHAAQEARLVLPVKPGPVARFGKISVTGSPRFSAHHVGVIARFKPGDRFQQSDVVDLRRALVQTGLVWDPLESTCRHASLSIL